MSLADFLCVCEPRDMLIKSDNVSIQVNQSKPQIYFGNIWNIVNFKLVHLDL